ncbi:FtsK/SpoIIIE domain-containing protein [Sinanaerobacter sp. ZZT-01]|uniref:FtsK/SpoIIIE domain-containing protein n=1 Tax=Sinanaerobacter sp. ZZT-01 TaxID=3111540 RepID=UPI002D7734A8|nr:FtsK/SpoIIIE domain-containing protein [Sinanaerobacter sp. ZZT-01]WRR94191.1 FtsK/SpoIIIE domain-containing protein [Sinanaerobacter sp. ZZT-01]
MAKSNLDKGDQQLELVGNYLINFFKGVGAGTKKILKEQGMMVLFVIVTLVSGAIFYLRANIALHFIPNQEFHILKIALLLVPVLPVLFLYIIGTNDEKSEDFEQKFAQIKFCGKDGSYPKFKEKEKKEDGKKVIYSFFSPSIELQVWETRKTELENVLDCNILKIENAKKSKQVVRLHAVPAEIAISENLPWSDDYIKEKDWLLCLGQGLLDEAVIDLNKYPHALIAGVTGSGKSVNLRCLLWQCVKKGAKIYMFDFKGGVEFGREYEQFGEVVTERQRALEILKVLVKEMKLRLKLFRECNVKNLAEYNELHPNRVLCRIVAFCDEVSEMLDKTGLQKSDQKIYLEIEKEMASLARLARAAGINMILGTQRPDAQVIAGQIKNNLPIRISGRMVDKHASEMVLGNTKASQMGDTLGRFLYSVGADTYEFQAFNFSDSSLTPGDYQVGEMLLEQSHHKYEMDDDNSYEEELEEDYEDGFEDEEEFEFQGF